MVCNGYSPPRLLRFNPAANRWLDESAVGALPEDSPVDWAGVQALPGADGAIVYVVRRPRPDNPLSLWGLTRTFLWQGGRLSLLLDDDAADSPLAAPYQPPAGVPGQRLLFHRASADGSSGVYWLDAGACPGASCQAHQVEGLPLWSPDGNSTLLVVYDEPRPRQLAVLAGQPHLCLRPAGR
jgi:hypothetical protein